MNGDALMRSNNFFCRASQAANFGENLFPRRRHVLHAAKADVIARCKRSRLIIYSSRFGVEILLKTGEHLPDIFRLAKVGHGVLNGTVIFDE